jgi:hypothetical protein
MNNPVVYEIMLKRDYAFQYENFVLATQNDLYLLLQKVGTSVSLLKFSSSSYKYGSPNDEARGGHPLTKFGLGWYGLYQVENSPWIQELMVANRVHDRHQDSMYADKKHYVACFKDVMLEVVCRGFEEIQLEQDTFLSMVQEQLACLE